MTAPRVGHFLAAIVTAMLVALGACAEFTLPFDAEDPAPEAVGPGNPGQPETPSPEGPEMPPPETPPQSPAGPQPAPPAGPPGIYLSDADGSSPHLLVPGDRPAWSPDGRRLAFHREGAIHVIGVDGTGETRLHEGHEPAWAPDGKRIAFAGREGIAVMTDQGLDVTTIVRHGFREDTWADDMGVGKPAWSPDGGRIAFEHRGDGDMTPAQIFVMNADGSNLHRLTPAQGVQYAESDPAWSPDGSRIVFWSYGHGIAVAPATGGSPRTIYWSFPAVGYGARPAWSPDGQTIAFTSAWFSAVWAVAAEGGKPRTLVSGSGEPAWSPDGASLAFTRLTSGD